MRPRPVGSYVAVVRVIIDFGTDEARPWTGMLRVPSEDAEVVGFGAGQHFDGRLDLLRMLEDLLTRDGEV